MNNLKEKMEIEKQEWQNKMIQKNEAELHQREVNSTNTYTNNHHVLIIYI